MYVWFQCNYVMFSESQLRANKNKENLRIIISQVVLSYPRDAGSIWASSSDFSFRSFSECTSFIAVKNHIQMYANLDIYISSEIEVNLLLNCRILFQYSVDSYEI